MPRPPADAPKISRLMLLAAVCIVVAALYFAQTVLIPLALAMLLSFLLSPLVSWLERRGVRQVPAVLSVVCILALLIAVLGYVVGHQLYDLADNIDQYKDNIAAKLEKLRPNGGVFEKLKQAGHEFSEKISSPATTQSTQPATVSRATTARKLLQNEATPAMVPSSSSITAPATPSPIWTKDNPLPIVNVESKSAPLENLGKYIGLVLGPLGTGGIVIVFVIFMLLNRDDLRNRLLRLAGGSELTLATQALNDASSRISRYLTAQAMVNGTYGIAVALGLWIIGLTLGRHDPSGTQNFPNFLLWAILCFLLRFIPYIGPWIACSFPLLVALAVYKSISVAIAVASLFVGIELISNNLMEPWLYGASTGMSTMAILVAAVFWTWLWGPVGLLLSTPLTVVLVVLGKYAPQFEFLDVLLGDEPALDPPSEIYQRMIALDAEEPAELVQKYRSQMSLEKLYDDILVPALRMAEQDREKGLLDDRRQRFVRATMRDLIEELGDKERSLAAAADAASADLKPDAPKDAPTDVPRTRLPKDCRVSIVALPSHDEGDEIVNLMLVQLLELRGYCASSVSTNSLASEMIAQINEKSADVVVVSALPPAAVGHARYLCKRVHAQHAGLPMAVGLWGHLGDLDKARERMTCVAAVQIVTSLTQMQDQVEQLAQPAIVRAKNENKTNPGNTGQ